MTSSHDGDLSASERARFAALPRIADGDDLSEERTVAALRARRLIGPRRRMRIELFLGAIAATLLVFVGGVRYGQHLSSAAALEVPPEQQVQQAGTAYLAAMVRLSESAPTDSLTAVVAGLEAGSVALRAVASNALRLLPENATVWRIHDGLELATGRIDPPLVWN